MSRLYTDINGEDVVCVYSTDIDDDVNIEQILWSTPPKDVLPLFIMDDDIMSRLELEILESIEDEELEALITDLIHQQESDYYYDEI